MSKQFFKFIVVLSVYIINWIHLNNNLMPTLTPSTRPYHKPPQIHVDLQPLLAFFLFSRFDSRKNFLIILTLIQQNTLRFIIIKIVIIKFQGGRNSPWLRHCPWCYQVSSRLSNKVLKSESHGLFAELRHVTFKTFTNSIGNCNHFLSFLILVIQEDVLKL